MGYGDTATLNSLFSGKLAIGSFGLPAPFFFLVVVAVLAAIFLNRTIWGRYLLALGNNEEGARYSGIGTDRLKITAYVICSFWLDYPGFCLLTSWTLCNQPRPVSFTNSTPSPPPCWAGAVCAEGREPSSA